LAGGERTTKKLAQRIDLTYFKRPHPFRTWRFWLSVAAPLVAIMWIAWYALAGSSRVYSGGKMSSAHAVLTAKCDACHLRTASSFSAKASDQACLSCHDGPVHHTSQVFTPNCASCHEEHRRRMRLAATDSQNRHVRNGCGRLKYVRSIRCASFFVVRSPPATIALFSLLLQATASAALQGSYRWKGGVLTPPPTVAS